MWGNDDYEVCEVYASDMCGGGVVAIWDPNTLTVTNKQYSDRWVLLEGRIKNANFDCCIGVVYGPNNRKERNSVFAELKCAIMNINKPTLLMGDFNVILHSWERLGTFRCDRSITEFSEWIRDLGLIDIPLQGLKFTWRRNESRSKLDRGLCCNDWPIKFPQLNMQGLKTSCSDHNPLLLNLENSINWAPKPFRSYDAWFLNLKFKSFICNEWRNLPRVTLNNKLKILKGPLKAWNKEHFGDMDNKISNLETAIHDLEKLSDDRSLNDMEIARLNAAQTLLQICLIRRERIWRQKARSYGFEMKDNNISSSMLQLYSRGRKMRLSKSR